MPKRSNGEGTVYAVYKNPKNKRAKNEKPLYYQAQYVAGYNSDGSSNRKTITGKSKTELQKRLHDIVSSINHKSYVEKTDITISDLGKELIETELKLNKLSESAFVRKSYTLKIINELEIANIPIQTITISQINQSLPYLTKYANSTINKTTGLLNTIFQQAIIRNIINYNPFAIKGAILRPKSDKIDKPIEALTIEEQRLFVNQLNNSNDKYKDVFLIALYTGMRVGEILALKGTDIDLQNNIIYINKTLTRGINDKVKIGTKTKTYAGTREIPFLDNLKPILINYANSDNFCFMDENKLISPATINSHFKRICKNANIQVINTKKKKNNNGKESIVNLKSSSVNTHMLRHTFATRCIESGMPAVVLSRYLGHKDIETTLNIYTSVFNEYKEDTLKNLKKYLVALKLH